MSIRQRLTTSYAIVLVFLLAIVLISLQRFDQQAQSMHDVVEGDAARAKLASAINLHAETAASRLLLLFVLEDREQRTTIYQEIDAQNAEIDQALQGFRALMSEPESQAMLARLESLRNAYETHFSATVEELEVGERASAVQLMTGPTLSALNALLAQTAALAEQQQLSMQARQAQAVQASERSIQLVLALGFSALIAGLLMAIYMTRSITQPLDRAGMAADRIAGGDLSLTIDKVGKAGKDEIGKLLAGMRSMCERLRTVIGSILSSAAQVDSAAEQLRVPAAKVKADSALQNELACSIDRSIAQLSQGIGAMAGNVSTTRDQALKARDLAQEGARAISVVAAEIAQIATAVDGSAQSVARLGLSAKEVAGAVSLIRQIADQTNLLALNASIEAARAGDSGRGFAVVADEVRTLANRTADVTEEIDRVMTLINQQTQNATRDIDAGKRGMEHGMGLIQSIAVPLEALQTDAQDSLDNLEQLTALAADQARESEAIAGNVRTIVEMARTNKQATDQLSTITGELLQTAAGLQASVAAFRL
ncbi:putative methyl-accepting chemotaxis protein YoaH [Pseudomonas sp. SCT]|jgi:methyl-accepting chemotaxis protein|nr:methyl-accepting chemotaxis protein [Pseudomonas sp. SCT]GCA58233.1 putative methyl-accepting chemotaxis protein YoaH [Pseudomonas sp. SCT]